MKEVLNKKLKIMSKVMNCSCQHESQDKLYGRGMRLFNECTVNGREGYRCTVCGKEVTTGDNKK